MPSRRDLIRMTPDEVARVRPRHAHDERRDDRRAMARPHLVAMWYGFLGEDPAFWTFGKSQKIVNLKRDPRITCLIETGDEYAQLRGVELVGRGTIITDPERDHRDRAEHLAASHGRRPRCGAAVRRSAGREAARRAHRGREGRVVGPPQARRARTERRRREAAAAALGAARRRRGARLGVERRARASPRGNGRPERHRPPGLRAADRRGSRRTGALGARRRPARPGVRRAAPPLRAARRARGRARGAHGGGRGLLVVVVLTNACGSMVDAMPPGQIVLISDHINMTAVSPLEGLAVRRPHRSVLVAAPRRCAATIDPSLPEGVYVGYWGPNYETPAEIRAFRTLGGDLVGMSTVLEAIAAHALRRRGARAVAGDEPRRGPRWPAPSRRGARSRPRLRANAPAPSSPPSSRTRAAAVQRQLGWLSSMRLPDGSRTNA